MQVAFRKRDHRAFYLVGCKNSDHGEGAVESLKITLWEERRKRRNARAGGRKAWSLQCSGLKILALSHCPSCCPRYILREWKEECFWGHVSDCHSFLLPDDKGHQGELLSELIEPEKQVFCDGKGHLLYSTKLGLSDCLGILFWFIVKARRFIRLWILTSGVIYTEPVIQQLQY